MEPGERQDELRALVDPGSSLSWRVRCSHRRAWPHPHTRAQLRSDHPIGYSAKTANRGARVDREHLAGWAAAALASVLVVAATAALAAPTDEEIARLGGPELTPVGAERAGNAEGTIPEWKGGVTEPPPGWKPGMKRVDLFGDDPILFRIDASNVDQHADKLTPGQIALVKSYDGYVMDVYPTRRSCAYPEDYYENAKQNARVARVDDDCFLRAGIQSPLFPLPENGCQVIQNAKLSIFNAVIGFDRIEVTLVPTNSGSFVPIRRRQIQYSRSVDPDFGTFDDLEGIWAKALNIVLSPPKQAGEITLVHVLTNGHLEAWTYNPGQRRVRRNPNFEYDNPVPGWQGLVTIDAVNGYVGAADRYEWKLLGKREIYIPYNNLKFFGSDLKYQDLIQARYPRRDLIHYELHRVWVVEATVRPNKRHTIARRVFYIDEDSWLIVVVDGYDNKGNLWRVSEHLPQLLYEIPSCVSNSGHYYDLVAGRYLITPAFNEEQEADYLAGHNGVVGDDYGFTPDNLRRMGKR